ncbi:MAG: RagB/SusD family nutrient uptake outer membrane protein, partial [Bacteroidetes bacterium]|nr:RagB/SusD family nutrient uptake outer membrane protein [Bacteroidota bacterium]
MKFQRNNTPLKTAKTLAIGTLAFASLGIALSGCRKSFLDETPRVQTPDDYFNSTSNAAQELVTAVYSKLYDWQQHSFSWLGMTSIASDEGEKGSDPGDTGSDKDQFDKLSWSPTSISFGEVWESNFEGIARANKAIDILPTLDINSSLRDRLMGESRFLRAYFYWNLVRSFGGVPLIPQVPKTAAEIEALNYRATADQIYDFIDADLEFAATVLPSSYLSDQAGRVTSGAAKALLAKSSLYRKRYGKAESLCAEIIASSSYALYADYSKLFRETGEFCSESIWEVNCKGSAPAKAIEGYFVVQAPRGVGGLGWGFNTPTQTLVDAFEPGDLRKGATYFSRGDVLWDGYECNTLAPNARYNYKSYVSKTMESWGKDDWFANKNMRILRYADVLLIHAEAANENGKTADALKSLNLV